MLKSNVKDCKKGLNERGVFENKRNGVKMRIKGVKMSKMCAGWVRKDSGAGFLVSKTSTWELTVAVDAP